MNQNSTPHLTPHTGFRQIQKTPHVHPWDIGPYLDDDALSL